jgi:hypothetical protein
MEGMNVAVGVGVRVLLGLLATSTLPVLSFGSEPKKVLNCDVEEPASIQKFMKVDSRPWSKHSEPIPDGDETEVATIKAGKETLVVIDSDTAGDILTHEELCYGGSGRLIRSTYEVRTAWGWGYREEAPEAYFVRLSDGHRIPVPNDPMDGAELAKHPPYKRISALPFAALINKTRTDNLTTNDRGPTTPNAPSH